MDRRTLFTAVLGACGAVLSAVIAVPTLIAALSPDWRPRPEELWQSVGPIEEFPLDRVVPAKVSLERGDWADALEVKAVYVWRKAEQEFVVFSRNCTDLSCPVVFDSGSQCFFCPCHGGIFGRDGSPMAGPPQVPLYRFANRIRDGVLEIDLVSLPPMT